MAPPGWNGDGAQPNASQAEGADRLGDHFEMPLRMITSGC